MFLHVTSRQYINAGLTPLSWQTWADTWVMILMQAKPLVLNSIHCNPCRPWQFTVAGGDAYIRVYDRRKAQAASCSAEEDEEDSSASTRSFAAALATPVRNARLSLA